jgi:hypothetical protein
MKPRQCSVLPSPTPIMPISEEDITVIGEEGNAFLKIKDVNSPAVPEPTLPKDSLNLLSVIICP